MKATWKPRPGDTAGLTVVLGDDALGFRAAGSKFILLAEPDSIAWQNQLAAYPRADAIETFGRDNVTTAYRVIVDYQFRTIGERTAFQHRLATDLVNEGLLEITHDAGGQDSMEAVIQDVQKVASNGLSLTLQYTFIGGALTRGPASNLIPVP